jgi:hypothetical protein
VTEPKCKCRFTEIAPHDKPCGKEFIPQFRRNQSCAQQDPERPNLKCGHGPECHASHQEKELAR